MYESVDYFTDTSLIRDPNPYFDWVREKGPVWIEPKRGVAIVTGFREAFEVYKDPERFSAVNAASGPFCKLPLDELEGDDVTPLLERYGSELPLHGFMATMDPPRHNQYRALMAKLFTPKRLKENQDFMWLLADQQLDEIVDKGACEFMYDYADTFTKLVIADLLGMPEEDRDELAADLSKHHSRSTIGGAGDKDLVEQEFLHDRFTTYIEERRRDPRNDILSSLALATFGDGTRPEVRDLVRESVFLFVAGQETTARLLGAQMLFLAEDLELQARLRDDRGLIPNFVEESLRLESPSKVHFRLSRHSTTLGGVDLPAGTTVMLAITAINHDPKRFDHPNVLDLDRTNSQEHITFIRGVHACIGQTLARTEARISIERILDRMDSIRISEAHHGPAGARRYEYDPTFLLRGLLNLHVEYTAVPT